ncbi:MAG: type Z 30S ribosomal protein S14 [Chloroflexi bacterium]|nr:type Z 30S ribosomal protein S14 [Chloroflexota bacterium]
MARKCKVEKWKRTPRFKVQVRNRCNVCGRVRAYIRMFGLCRLCFRQRALKGELPGIRKASW